MLLEFWGTRGSFPVSGQEYSRFGVATACASLRWDEETYLVIDAGTGIKKLGEFLSLRGNVKKVFLLLTHFHLDHISGLPSFAPLYDPEFTLIIYAPLSPSKTWRELDRLMGGRFFPISFSATACQKEIYCLRAENTLGSLDVYSFPLPHPQGNVGLRLEKDGRSVVFATDAEPEQGRWAKEVLDRVKESTCLVAECMYTPGEYRQGKIGWGHGSWMDAVRLAREARCQKLVLSHWNPNYSDEKIKTIMERVRREFSAVYAARPGWRLTI